MANHEQLGDPVGFGKVMIGLAHNDKPPVRFAAGSDAVQVMNERVASLQATTDQWRQASLSTDIKTCPEDGA